MQSNDADWGWGGTTAADFEYSSAHECGLFHGTIDTTGRYPYSPVTSPTLTDEQKNSLAAAEGLELCIQVSYSVMHCRGPGWSRLLQ